jgi:2-dehydro-3-deoxyphosphogluconate aldolase/(4S)-4-hydroxy-2-oxoglutarate aldolase
MNDRQQTNRQLIECGVIAVVRLDSASALTDLTETLRSSGITAIEFTLTTPGALDTLKSLAPRYDDVLFGAGTVLSAEMAQQAVQAGARFLVAPILKRELIEIGHQANVPVILGGLTPTELWQAWEWGADFVKLFPASSVGPEYIKAVRAPLPQLRIMPTGGVSLENATAYLQAGAACLGVGGKLVDKKLIAEGRFEEIADYARRLVAVVHAARNGAA